MIAHALHTLAFLAGYIRARLASHRPAQGNLEASRGDASDRKGQMGGAGQKLSGRIPATVRFTVSRRAQNK
mgnify:CR=1 FL=1